MDTVNDQSININVQNTNSSNCSNSKSANGLNSKQRSISNEDTKAVSAYDTHRNGPYDRNHQIQRKKSNIDLEVLFSSFTSSTDLGSREMTKNDYKAALEYFNDALRELRHYTSLDQIPPNKVESVSVVLVNQSICFAKEKRYDLPRDSCIKCIW